MQQAGQSAHSLHDAFLGRPYNNKCNEQTGKSISGQLVNNSKGCIYVYNLMMASIVIITTVTRDSHLTQQHPQDRQGTFQPHTLDCRFHLLSYYHYFVIMIYNDYYYYFCYLLLSSQTSVACQRLIDNTHLQQLHHGKADISIHVIVLHQLLLQADWLTQIHIGLAQQVEQRHCLLIVWSSTLQTGLNIVSPAVQQQWVGYRLMGC